MGRTVTGSPAAPSLHPSSAPLRLKAYRARRGCRPPAAARLRAHADRKGPTCRAIAHKALAMAVLVAACMLAGCSGGVPELDHAAKVGSMTAMVPSSYAEDAIEDDLTYTDPHDSTAISRSSSTAIPTSPSSRSRSASCSCSPPSSMGATVSSSRT